MPTSKLIKVPIPWNDFPLSPQSKELGIAAWIASPIPDQTILNHQQLMELTEVLENGMRIVVANNIPFDEVWTSSGLNIPRSVGN